MSDINVSIPAGAKKRLLTGGKYCPDDIVIETTGGDTDAAFEAGRQAEHDAFWYEFQYGSDGKQKTYLVYYFSGQGWNSRNFKPKYDITPVGAATGMFRQSSIANLSQILADCGVTLDTSQATDLSYAFGFASFTKLPKIDMSLSTRNEGIFVDTPVEEITEIVVSAKTTFTTTSFRCKKLTHMPVSGVIAQSNFNVSACTLLDKDSITSIVNALSTSTSGLTVTLSNAAVNTAFETSTGAADGATSAEWLALENTKKNWTITLA